MQGFNRTSGGSLFQLLMPAICWLAQPKFLWVPRAASVVGTDALEGVAERSWVVEMGVAKVQERLDLWLGGIKPTAVTHHMQGQIASIKQHLLLMADPQRLGPCSSHPGAGCITGDE